MKFGKLTKLIENVQKLDQRKIFVSIVSDKGIQQYIISLNTVDQMFLDSVNSSGDSLGSYSDRTFLPPYDKGTYFTQEQVYLDDEGLPRTVQVSKDLSGGEGIILYNEGDFYDEYKVSIDNGGFTINANTIKGDTQKIDLSLEYGDIVGLNEKSKSELAQAIIPIVIRYVKNSLVDEIPRDLFV